MLKAKIISGIIKNEQGEEITTYGVQVGDITYYDISVDKELILKFVDFLNSSKEPTACLDVVIEDLLS